jgi:hypothetical protein
MRLYISGPITGLDRDAAQNNFASAAQHLQAAGYDTLNPFDIAACQDASCQSQEGDVHHTWECSLKHDLIEMLKCDGVAVIPGWGNSKGAQLEVATANGVGMEAKGYLEWIKISRELTVER